MAARPISATTPQTAVARPAANAATPRTPTAQPAAQAQAAKSTANPANGILATQSTYQQLVAAANNSGKRIVHNVKVLSIREELQKQNDAAHAPAATQPTQTAAAQQPTEKLNTPFNDDRLTYYWFRYAQQLPKEKAATAGRMKSMPLKLDTSTWSVKAVVENELVEATMRQEQISLMNYLRTQLRNDYITLQFEIAPNNMPRRATSRLERYKSMLQRYPALEMLRKELDLELA